MSLSNLDNYILQKGIFFHCWIGLVYMHFVLIVFGSRNLVHIIHILIRFSVRLSYFLRFGDLVFVDCTLSFLGSLELAICLGYPFDLRSGSF